MEFTKWVACWGNATSISDRTEATYSKDITFRYPIRVVFNGSKIRLHLSNLTGTEPITITKTTILKGEVFTDVYFEGKPFATIEPGRELTSDEVEIDLLAGDSIEVSMYLGEFTQMNAGTLVTGPLSKGSFSYGDFAHSLELDANVTRSTNWFYFLNTVDIFTEEQNRALICYGDSITAQSWPDYLAMRAWDKGFRNVAIIRRAVCGTRILRQYDCATYAAYGLKGATRFPIESVAAGADTILIQHGINDIIHPVGVEVNKFRPWEDMPTTDELIEGFTALYIEDAKARGLNVWAGTLLPIYGWRTYADFRDEIRSEFNTWLKTTDKLDGCVDFDRAVRNPEIIEAFAEGFDSGDHLHPSEAAYEAMANAVPEELIK